MANQKDGSGAFLFFLAVLLFVIALVFACFMAFKNGETMTKNDKMSVHRVYWVFWSALLFFLFAVCVSMASSKSDSKQSRSKKKHSSDSDSCESDNHSKSKSSPSYHSHDFSGHSSKSSGYSDDSHFDD